MHSAGYQNAGVFGASAMVVSMLIFSIGLRKFIPKLRQNQTKEPLSVRQVFRQTIDVFKGHSARMASAAGVMYYVGNGTYVALWVYIYSYFWEFSNQEIAIIVTPMAFAALILPSVLLRLTRRREKKNVAIIGLSAALAVNVIPITLCLHGFFPENGSDTLLWTMVVMGFLETNLFLIFDISWRSMISDLTEKTQLETGRRNEGVIMSSITFITKCADGVGTLVAGLLLSIIAFPTETAVGEVPQEIIFDLGLIYGPMVFVIYAGAIFAIGRYRISRTRHQEMLDRLSKR